MKTEKKNHTKASLNLYLVAGLYLLYIDYSLLSKWSEIETDKKTMVVIAASAFGVFAIGIIAYALKGLIAIKNRNIKLMEEINKEEV